MIHVLRLAKGDETISGDEVEIPAGSHTYNFSAKLPDSLPSSFESQFGYVRYTVKAILNRPWKFDQECKAAFTVVSPLDLNKVPESKVSYNLIECLSRDMQLTDTAALIDSNLQANYHSAVLFVFVW